MIINERHEIQAEAKTPILSSIFRAMGIIAVGGAAISGLLIYRAFESEHLSAQGHVFMAASFLGSALVCFGIGELIHLIAKIEFNTRGGKDQAILESLHRIESALEAARREK